MSIHFNIPSSEKQENSLECLTKRTSSLLAMNGEELFYFVKQLAGH